MATYATTKIRNKVKYNKYWFPKVGLNKNNAIQIKENTIHFSFNTKGLPNNPPVYIYLRLNNRGKH